MHRHVSLLLVTAINGLTFIPNDFQNSSLQIQLPDGVIQGRLRHTVDSGSPYYSYEGIPYAEPPVGELRFEPPQPPRKWDGVLEAHGDVPSCLQIPPNGYEDEDCLYLNVYVPKLGSETEPKAVMVWIYGGGFILGAANSNIYGPDYLLEKDVIVVHFNYRLNVFGFFSTNDLASPGNYGLKDQQAALKWVHTNIPFFGGDPNRVTIFGESAGAASVSYLLFSPKSEGLFQRAISQSGTTLCPWALQRDPLNVARIIATSAGFYYFASTDSILQHLKGMNATDLRRAALNTLLADSMKREQGLTFAPVLEPEHEDAFLTKSTFEKLKSGEFVKVPYIVGFNSQESAMAQKAVEFVRPFLRILPDDTFIPSSLNNWDWGIGTDIKNHYFTDDKSRIDQYVEFFSDTVFNRGILEAARLYSLHAPTFMYRFSYEGYFLGKKAFLMNPDHDIQGVSHAEELWYLFARDDLRRSNTTDRLMRERMVRLWSNFAKSGNPTPDDDLLLNVTWPRFEKDDYPYLNIDIDLSVEFNFKEETMEFWRQLFAKYGRPPFNTY